jgi:hypothetical protein
MGFVDVDSRVVANSETSMARKAAAGLSSNFPNTSWAGATR